MTGFFSSTRVRQIMVLALTTFLVLALGMYFFLLLRWVGDLVGTRTWVGILFGCGLLILVFLGVWMVAATLRSGFRYHILAQQISSEGGELDVSDLPRRPSGRIVREAADQLFATVHEEWQHDSTNWRSCYRLSRAYDYAGDRPRARAMMKQAFQLYEAEQAQGKNVCQAQGSSVA